MVGERSGSAGLGLEELGEHLQIDFAFAGEGEATGNQFGAVRTVVSRDEGGGFVECLDRPR